MHKVINVLIADDHTIVRHGLQEILTKELAGAQVYQAKDSREALDLLLKQAWDLVLLDINMPGRNGLEILQESKRLHPRVPVLILSAYPEEEFALRAFQLGASGYLNKQSAFDELIVAVKKILVGGKYVTATLAERMADHLGGETQTAPHETLSSREFQVFRLVALGKTLKEIAAELSLSEKTVGVYRARIGEKMGLSSNVDIARYALQHKLVE